MDPVVPLDRYVRTQELGPRYKANVDFVSKNKTKRLFFFQIADGKKGLFQYSETFAKNEHFWSSKGVFTIKYL